MRRRGMGTALDVVGPASDPTLLETDPESIGRLPWDLGAAVQEIRDQPGTPAPGARLSGNELARYAWAGAVPVQGDALLNFGFVSPAGQDLLIPLPAAVGVRIHLYTVAVRCSGGTTTLTIQDGTLFLYPPGLIPAIGVNLTPFTWAPGLTFRENSPGLLTLTAAGPGNIVYAAVQADRF